MSRFLEFPAEIISQSQQGVKYNDVDGKCADVEGQGKFPGGTVDREESGGEAQVQGGEELGRTEGKQGQGEGQHHSPQNTKKPGFHWHQSFPEERFSGRKADIEQDCPEKWHRFPYRPDTGTRCVLGQRRPDPPAIPLAPSAQPSAGSGCRNTGHLPQTEGMGHCRW